MYEYKITQQIESNIKVLEKILDEFKNINKNLEKIANKDFLQIGDIKTTVNEGKYFYNKNREFDPNTILLKGDTMIGPVHDNYDIES